MDLQSIFSLEIIKDKKSFKKKAIRMLASFLMMMLLLTILSRAADAVTMAQVETGYTYNMTLSYPIEITGTINAHDTFAVFSDENLRVEYIAVQEGSKIENGDVLFTVDLNYLEEQIETVEREIERKELQLDAIEKSASYQQQERQMNIDRANEDYQDTVKSAQDLVDNAYQDLLDAEAALNNYPAQPQIDWSDQQWEEEKAQLEENYKQAQVLYEQAKKDKEESLKSASRQVEDANLSLETDNAKQLQEMDIEDLNKVLGKYNQLREEQGQVKSDKAGTVLLINVAVGDITSTGPVIMAIDHDKGFQFVGEMTQEQAIHLREGDLVDINPLFLDGKLEKLSVNSIQYLTDGSGNYQVSVDIPEGMADKEGTGTLEVTKESERYYNCVDLEALHTQDGNIYVLAVEESTTILGVQNVIIEVPVTVLEKNSSYAAVEGNLDSKQKIITRTNKPVKPGDRVRLIEN